MNNPFTTPNILDRTIEVFTACSACNSAFVNTEGEINYYSIWDNDIITISCKKCKTEYKFKNWNKEDVLGIWRKPNDKLPRK